jgi:hypothetical protein
MTYLTPEERLEELFEKVIELENRIERLEENE